LDVKITKAPGTPLPWLDRARLLTLSEHPNLALKDCEHAIKLAPGMMRARIQCGEALLDLGRIEDAAILGISSDLQRDENKHLSDDVLHALQSSDESVLKDPDQPEPFVVRAKVLCEIKQYTLALTDAQTALKLDPGSALAHLQAAKALGSLDRPREAIAHAEKATLLDPGDPVVWYYRGLLEANRANFEAAIEWQSRSLAIRKSIAALLERERCERRIGRIAEAEADAQRRKQLPVPQESSEARPR
jgi:tetratricopeptide (TPR) repeat protein